MNWLLQLIKHSTDNYPFLTENTIEDFYYKERELIAIKTRNLITKNPERLWWKRQTTDGTAKQTLRKVYTWVFVSTKVSVNE